MELIDESALAKSDSQQGSRRDSLSIHTTTSTLIEPGLHRPINLSRELYFYKYRLTLGVDAGCRHNVNFRMIANYPLFSLVYQSHPLAIVRDYLKCSSASPTTSRETWTPPPLLCTKGPWDDAHVGHFGMHDVVHKATAALP